MAASWHEPLRDCVYFEEVSEASERSDSIVAKSLVRTASYQRSVSCACGATTEVDTVWFVTIDGKKFPKLAAFTTGSPCSHWMLALPPDVDA